MISSLPNIDITGDSLILRGEREFSLLNLINIKTTNAALNFNFEEQEATLSGKFNIPSLNDLELD